LQAGINHSPEIREKGCGVLVLVWLYCFKPMAVIMGFALFRANLMSVVKADQPSAVGAVKR
jgi:hypothetical protein